MKTLLLFGAIALSINVFAQSTVKIGIEVMTEDLGKMTWEDAMKACADLGDGWRLPTKDELNMMYENKDKIGGFTNDFYWSSSELDINAAWGQSFSNGFSTNGGKYGSENYVRAVRAFYQFNKLPS